VALTYGTLANSNPITAEITGLGQKISVRCPVFFYQLLRATLTGWSFKEQQFIGDSDIEVTTDNTQFLISSRLVYVPPSRGDIIDALNEFFLALSYLIAARARAKLVHCGAFVENERENVALFGKKNSGKSTFVFEKACNGDQVLADDLLLWSPATGSFSCLGLPLRMRRPVRGIHREERLVSAFIAGETLAYSRSGYFNIAPVGKRVFLDRLYLYAERCLNPVDMRRYPSILLENVIAEKFLELRR
jgi:hypothetical protein